MMTNPILNASFILFIVLLNCKASDKGNARAYVSHENITGYNFTAPDYRLELDDELHEISGLTLLDTTTFACIEDELGLLFIYDLAANKIKNKYSFYTKGDFEDITRVGKTFYILRSDATLFELPNYEIETTHPLSYILDIPALDNEGLCYDPEHDRLLIASKGNAGKTTDLKNTREIYGFDLKTKTLMEVPVFKFDERIIKRFILDNKIDAPMKIKKSGETEPDIRFKPTAIGIHPLTKKLFLLSGPDHLILIFSATGALEYLEVLNPELFNQPEGLAFFENGDLLITNEGGDKKPTLFRFNYRKK